MSILAISLGAALGALARWLLGNALNLLFPTIPPGTLLANLIGGYLIGIALVVFASHPGITHEWRLFLVTGFLGGLTTFSTFSAEAVVLLQRGAYGWALLHAGVHLLGSVALCIAGFATWRWLTA